MIRITPHISIGEAEVREEFIRSSGPGGQNVNKVATAVQLRFDAAASPSLSEEIRRRLVDLAGPSRSTAEGEIVIAASRYRSQRRNREDAMERLVGLIRRAAARPKPRRRTRPTRASKQRRLSSKRRRSQIKHLRGERPDEE